MSPAQAPSVTVRVSAQLAFEHARPLASRPRTLLSHRPAASLGLYLPRWMTPYRPRTPRRSRLRRSARSSRVSRRVWRFCPLPASGAHDPPARMTTRGSASACASRRVASARSILATPRCIASPSRQNPLEASPTSPSSRPLSSLGPSATTASRRSVPNSSSPPPRATSATFASSPGARFLALPPWATRSPTPPGPSRALRETSNPRPCGVSSQPANTPGSSSAGPP